MTTTTKKYPRARISPHPTLNGWTVDLFLRAGAKPIKVNATYATLDFAHKAALVKLGVKTPAPVQAEPLAAPRVQSTLVPFKPEPRQPKPAGTCVPCGRSMRPAGTKATDYPGTVLRQREGLCQSCNYQKKEPK